MHIIRRGNGWGKGLDRSHTRTRPSPLENREWPVKGPTHRHASVPRGAGGGGVGGEEGSFLPSRFRWFQNLEKSGDVARPRPLKANRSPPKPPFRSPHPTFIKAPLLWPICPPKIPCSKQPHLGFFLWPFYPPKIPRSKSSPTWFLRLMTMYVRGNLVTCRDFSLKGWGG